MPRKKTVTQEKQEPIYSKKRLKEMVKQNNLEDVSLISKVLNNVDILVVDENTGEVIDKDKTIEHFVIIKDYRNSEYMANFADLFKTRKSKSKNDELLEDQLDALAQDSEDSDFDLDDGDQTTYLPKDEMLMLIAKELRINEPSLQVLKEPGWYIVPIYAEQTEFRPVFFEETKKSTVLVMKNEPLFTMAKSPFPKNAKANTWQYNSMPIINQILSSIGVSRFMVYSAIRHFKDKHNCRALKIATRMFENVQKARIKIGNNIISNIYVQHGNIGFNELKLEQAKTDFPELFDDELYTKDGGEISEDVIKKRETVIKKIKILDCVSKEYEYLQNYVRSISQIPKEVLKIIRNMDKLEKSDDEIILKIAKRVEANPFSSYIRTEERFNEILEILKKNGNELRFLTTYDIYNQTREWMNYGMIEDETKMYAELLVESHPIWVRFLQGIRGVGKQLAAQLISGFDFAKAEHPSSFLKYIGLDQIPITPDEDQEITVDHQINALNLIIESYKRTRDIAERIDSEVNQDNFSTYATDGIETFKDWEIVEDWYNKSCLSDLDSPLKTQEKINANISKFMENYPNIRRIVNDVCKNYIVKSNIDMEGAKYINKRARTKQDRQITTYRTKKNKIAVKKYLGYNSALKGIVMGRVFTSFLKAGDKSYYENIYRDYSARLTERPDIKKQQEDYDNKVPGVRKPHVHAMARRKVCQIFVQDLFMNGRKAMNLPDNGGTYEEAKLGIHHRQGISTTEMYLDDPSEFKSNKEYEKYLKDNMH